MIKYLGSKRRMVPLLSAVAAASGARTALDAFTGTTRVAQAFKRAGIEVTAIDKGRGPAVLAKCFVATDADVVDHAELDDAIATLNALPGCAGYVTETFCVRSRFFQPFNGERIDAVRDAIDREYAGTWLEPVLLTSLLLAADRVDSTTGVQMAYVKEWAPRSFKPLELRVPALLPGAGRSLLGDAVTLVSTLPAVDLAYLDPPYNQHRYDSNYHVWETLVAWDAPEHYGVACKRADLREPESRSLFNSRRTMPSALAGVVRDVDAALVVLSYNDESWVTLDELRDMAATRGAVDVIEIDSKRYVGAQIGIHNPSGERVGTVGRLRNVEYVVLAGERAAVGRAGSAARGAAAEAGLLVA